MGQTATRHQAQSGADAQPLDLTSAAPAPAPGAPPAGTPVVPLSGEKGEAERPASPASNGEPMAATGACHSINLRNSLAKMRWTASSLDSLKAAEAKLLGAVGGLRVFDTDIGNGQHVHTVEGGKGKTELPVVMCHGYGMGVGGWHLNLAELTASTHVLAKDWLGCGLSARPKWDANGVEETEAFFVDSLERIMTWHGSRCASC